MKSTDGRRSRSANPVSRADCAAKAPHHQPTLRAKRVCTRTYRPVRAGPINVAARIRTLDGTALAQRAPLAKTERSPRGPARGGLRAPGAEPRAGAAAARARDV